MKSPKDNEHPNKNLMNIHRKAEIQRKKTGVTGGGDWVAREPRKAGELQKHWRQVCDKERESGTLARALIAEGSEHMEAIEALEITPAEIMRHTMQQHEEPKLHEAGPYPIQTQSQEGLIPACHRQQRSIDVPNRQRCPPHPCLSIVVLAFLLITFSLQVASAVLPPPSPQSRRGPSSR